MSGFDTITECNNLDQAERFYTQILGYRLVRRERWERELVRGFQEGTLTLVPMGTFETPQAQDGRSVCINIEEHHVADLEAAVQFFIKHDDVRFLSDLSENEASLDWPHHINCLKDDGLDPIRPWQKGDKYALIIGPDHSIYKVSENEFGMQYPKKIGLKVFAITRDLYTSAQAEIITEMKATYCADPIDPDWGELFENHLAWGYSSVRAVDTISLQRLASNIQNRLKLHGDYDVDVYNAHTRKSLWNAEHSEGGMLRDADIAEDDHIVVQFQTEGGHPKMMSPHDQTQDLRHHVVKDLKQISKVDHPHLVGVLLYTDEDQDVAQAVRSRFMDLHRMSGDAVRVHVLEHSPSRWRTAVSYWREVAKNAGLGKTYLLWSFLQWLTTIPLDRSQAIDIARQLGVYPDEMPCLVLMSEIQKGHSRLIIPVKGGDLRVLFSDLMRIVDQKPIGDRGELVLEQFSEELGKLRETRLLSD